MGKRKRDAGTPSEPQGSASTRPPEPRPQPVAAPLVEWRRAGDASSADALVASAASGRALVFEGLGGSLEAVEKLAGVKSLASFAERFEELLGRGKGSQNEEFRVFEECNRVCRMTWGGFMRANAEGRFAYCETASTGVHCQPKRSRWGVEGGCWFRPNGTAP